MKRLLKSSTQKMSWETPVYLKAKKRAVKLSTHDLISWADIAGTEMCRVLYDYSIERDETVRIQLLKELATAISGLQAVTECLMDREN